MNNLVVNDNALKLATLAGEINQMDKIKEDHANKAIIVAAQQGDKLRQARDLSDGDSFESWLETNCPRIKRSQAYNLMRLAKEQPELLDDSVQSNGKLLSPSQYFALFTASDDVKQDVIERVEAGETVPVSEINRLKKETQQAEEERQKAIADNESLLDDMKKLEAENHALKDDKKIDKLVRKRASAEIEKTQQALQAELNRVISEHEADYQRTIDHLNDTVSKLKNDLGKAQQPDALSNLQKQIVIAEQELERVNSRRDEVNSDMAYQNLAKHIMEQATNINITLMDLSRKHASTYKTSSLMLRAAHDLECITEILKHAAQFDQFDIEG